ncbi:MAG: DUF4143 domain-containing protein [Clostridia bacterium]|nr:DUF4143 domain-containing protein [Clostridia bacterium]
MDCILKAVDAIPADLNNTCKERMRDYYRVPYQWLDDACIAIPCSSMLQKHKKDPLSLFPQRDLFKMYMTDTGLLVAMDRNRLLQFNIMNGDIGANEGGILENVIAQHLACNDFGGFYGLIYHTVKDVGEITFVISQPDGIIPVMVISGKDYTEHKALNRLMNTKAYGLKQALVFCNGNISRDKHDERIIYLPLYMIMFLLPKNIMDFIDLGDPVGDLNRYWEEHHTKNKPAEGQEQTLEQ